MATNRGRLPHRVAEQEERPGRRPFSSALEALRDWIGRVLGTPEVASYRHGRSLKRSLDLVLTFVLAPGWLLLLAAAAAAIRLTSDAPVLFVQTRCGLHGRPFRLVKFRTMVVDAEARLEELLRDDPEARAEYEAYRKLRHDPRVTPLGRFLRRTSLDELPQLWNVLRGDMSLVGPRPYLARELTGVGPAGEEILSVPPGLTGLWQVTRRNTASFAERLSIDLHYARSWSVWRDVQLLARTLPVALAGKGAC